MISRLSWKLNHDLLKKKCPFLKMAKCKYSDYAEFQKVLNDAKTIVAITGAGISAESGIPTFRGPGGLWRTHRATDLATPQAFRANPSLVWEFYHYRREVAFNSHPNKGHLALAKFEELCSKTGRKLSIITQNVDGLHVAAGSKNVIELHGSLQKVICTKCKRIEVNTTNPICAALKDRGKPDADPNLPMIELKDLPHCKSCKGLLRPYIVWFGEHLDPQIMQQSRELVETCDICLVIGTSSVVYPAAMYAPTVAQRGKPVAEFNINEHPSSDEFDFHFCGPSGTTLPKALSVEDS